MVSLSLVIPHKNDLQDLRGCLEAVSRALINSPFFPGQFEIIVVDDGSIMPPDLSEIKNSKIIRNKESKGVGAARNQGGLKAKYQWIHFLDADVLVNPNFYKDLYNILSSDQNELKIFHGALSSEPANPRPNLFHIYQAQYNAFDEFWSSQEGNRSLLSSGCFFILKNYFEECGGFSAKFHESGGEEFDFLNRMKDGNHIPCFKELVWFHIYDSFFIRLKKVWKRSINYSETVLENEYFPSEYKIWAALRSVGGCLFLLGFFNFSIFFLLLGLVMIYGADKGRLLKFILKSERPIIALVMGPFIAFEYTAALLGIIYYKFLKPRKISNKVNDKR